MVEYAYDAWGKPLATTGSLASTLGVANPFRYRSYYFDSESGLYYCNARYYNAEWGRWVSADIATMAGADKNLLGTNIFAYCYNNPVMYRDPDGHLPWWLNDFLRGLKDGFVGSFLGMLDSFLHPLQTLKSIFSLKQMINNLLDPIGLSNAAKIIYYIAIGNFYKAGYTYGGVLYAAALVLVTIGLHKGAIKVGGFIKQTTTVQRLINSAGKLKYSKTAEAHLSSRPYMKSTQLIREIMKSKKPIADSSLKNGYKWTVEGAWWQKGWKVPKYGNWELVVDAATDTIVHFLFKPY